MPLDGPTDQHLLGPIRDRMEAKLTNLVNAVGRPLDWLDSDLQLDAPSEGLHR